MEIRSFKEEDRRAVIVLWEACGHGVIPDKDISRKLQVQPVELDQRLMASTEAGYDGHRGSIYYLAVAPEYQKCGYGVCMMQHVEDVLTVLRCPKLNVAVRNANANVINFYQRLGYSTEDVLSMGK